MDNLYMKGELLQVHTKNSEIFEGRFYGMTNDKSKISLYNVKEPKGDPSDGILHYYDSDIRDIVKLKEPDEQKHLKISEKECEEIIKTSKKYIYINQIDKTFHEAMEDLNQYNYIGLSTDGANMGRKCKMPVLVLSTPHQIYIFDIHVMEYHAFEAGLKKLLESDTPKKIIHNSRNVSDCLFHKHNVKLNSVFDTQVGDLLITRNKTGRLPEKVKSLAQCLNLYLGLQLSFVDDKFGVVECSARPLPVQMKDSLAKNIAFLHRLSETINEEMLLPFVRGVECFVENIRSLDDFKAWERCGMQNQIPKDFKSAIEY
ncbi:unnamed protein product [Spodoptera exigua]|nr:unnamed protein product [Spodoptera exigua]